MSTNVVSVEKIQEGIDYLENQFMNPLIKVGEQLIDEYRMLNQSLQSEEVDNLIARQQEELDKLRTDLESICEKAKSAMDDSQVTIQKNQANLNDTLSQI